MGRPTIEMVEGNLISWREAMYQLHRELDKMDVEAAYMRHELGIPEAELSPESLETIEIEIKPRGFAREGE